jgi:hypothetical protein
MVTVLTETDSIDVPAQPGASLWLKPEDVTQTTGWTLKQEGLCKDEICVPVPAGREDEFVRNGELNVSKFWSHMGKIACASKQGDVWFLGEGAQERNDALLSLAAPDFTLPDFSGKLHSLSDFRRKRVLLITWASW